MDAVVIKPQCIEVGPCHFRVEVEPNVFVKFKITEAGFEIKRHKHETVVLNFHDALAKAENQLTLNLV